MIAQIKSKNWIIWTIFFALAALICLLALAWPAGLQSFVQALYGTFLSADRPYGNLILIAFSMMSSVVAMIILMLGQFVFFKRQINYSGGDKRALGQWQIFNVIAWAGGLSICFFAAILAGNGFTVGNFIPLFLLSLFVLFCTRPRTNLII